MLTTNTNSSTFCANSLLVYHLNQIRGVDLSRVWLRHQLENSANYPEVSIADLINVLKTCNLDGMSVRIKPSLLETLEPPFIAYVEADVIGKCFILVKALDTNSIYYYTPDKGDVRETFQEFYAHWEGIVILVGSREDANTLTGENILETHDIEKYKNESVKEIYQFFSPKECRDIIDYTERRNEYNKSATMDSIGDVKIGNNRTSYSTGLENDGLPFCKEIKDRVSDFLKVPTSYIEGLQCVRYSEGQNFRPHFDSSTILCRKHTILVYLNDNFEGGETYFPELFLKITPEMGKALYFLNEDEGGNNIYYSRHAGLPVTAGTKYACNIWVKDRPASVHL